MKCNNCGAEIPDESKFCSNCSASVNGEAVSNQDMKDLMKAMTNLAAQQAILAQNQQAMMQGGSMQKNVEEKTNPLAGKVYKFESKVGTAASSVLTMTRYTKQSIKSEVEVKGDRLLITMEPEKFNKEPAIMLDDITTITVSKKMNKYYQMLCAVSFLCLFVGFGFIMLPIVLLIGFESEITIHSKSGKKIVIYSGNTSAADTFVKDIKGIVGC